VANEQTPSSIADIVAGEVLAPEFLMLLAERDGSVLNHPAFFHATGLPGSNVVRVPVLGHGYDLLSAATPGSDTANTAFSDDKIDVTIATYTLRYTNDQLAKWMADGKLDASLFAMGAVVSIAQTLISLAANVTDGFSNVAGSSGVNASWADVLVAKALLNVGNADGPMLGLVHGVQWGDLESDAASLGVLPAETNAGIINAELGAYKGKFFGVDWFKSNRVPTADAGANRAGAIWTPGGLVWADVAFDDEGDPNIVNLGRGQFERVRLGLASATAYMIRAGMGVSLGIDAAGVTLKTDA
jgi:hypothetical protein